MAGHRKRAHLGKRRRGRKKRRTWEGSKKRHAQAAARGWALHTRKKLKWKPKRAKWHGSRKSTAKKRTWEGDSARHGQAAAYGWYKSAGKKSWRPKRAKYSGVLKSTAKTRHAGRHLASGMKTGRVTGHPGMRVKRSMHRRRKRRSW